MHELSIASNIVEFVAQAAAGRRVRRVTLEIGRLSGVSPDALAFCFPGVARGTDAEAQRATPSISRISRLASHRRGRVHRKYRQSRLPGSVRFGRARQSHRLLGHLRRGQAAQISSHVPGCGACPPQQDRSSVAPGFLGGGGAGECRPRESPRPRASGFGEDRRGFWRVAQLDPCAVRARAAP